MANQSARHRLVCLFEILQLHSDENNIITLRQIKEWLLQYGFDVTARTINSDIAVLNDCGVGIVRVTSPRGYYFARAFSLDTFFKLVAAVDESPLLDDTERDEIKGFLHAISCEKSFEKIHRTISSVRLPSKISKINYGILQTIRQALMENKMLTLSFKNFEIDGKTGGASFVGRFINVSPHKVLLYGTRAYLLMTPQKSDCLNYIDISRIEDVEVLEKRAVRREDVHYSNAVSYFTNEPLFTYLPDIHLVMSCDNSVAEQVIEYFGADVEIKPSGEKGRFLAFATINLTNEFMGWLWHMCDKVRVIKPDLVSEYINQRIHALSKA